MKVQFTSDKQRAPDVEQGVKLPYAPGKRAASKAGWYVILFIVSSPLMYFIYQIFATSVLVEEPGYVTLIKREVSAGASGKIAALDVEVGDDVREGEVVARLVDLNLEAEARRVAAEMAALVQERVDGPTPTQRSLATHRLDLAEDELRFHQQRQDAIERLFQQGAATRAELNNADAAVRRAQLTVTEVREAIAAMDRTPLGAADSVDYARLRARAAELDSRREQLLQRAPTTGRVLDIFAQPNEVLAPGDPMLLIGEPKGPYITVYIDPKYSKYAELGQRATIKFPNGAKVGAQVVELPEVTQRLPAEFVGPLGLRRMKVLARLEADEPLSVGNRVDGLPVTVRFPFKL